jgi:hypothetical protein
VSDMRSFPKGDHHSGKHVDRAYFLDIATIFDHDPSPVATDGSAWSYVFLFTVDDIAGQGG